MKKLFMLFLLSLGLTSISYAITFNVITGMWEEVPTETETAPPANLGPAPTTPDQLAPAPATDQLTPASAPAPTNDDLCGAEVSDGVNTSCSGDVEITEAPAPVPTRRPDMFSATVVKYATTVTDWAKMGIPVAITKKYINDPTAGGKCDHECMMNIPTADSNAAKAEAVSAAEAASAADEASACERLPEGETAAYC